MSQCRICNSGALEPVISLGRTPLANAFVSAERLSEPEPTYPLEAVRCERCGLLQLNVVVRPEILFADYPYASSAAEPTVRHFDDLAAELSSRLEAVGRIVYEIGSNDGVLLAPLRARGVSAIGIEPAANLAASANARGLETIVAFFGSATAAQLASARGRALAVIANNVLAHVDDLQDLVAALDVLLDDDGVFIAEFPYVDDMLARVEYDTIYHEHLSYLALTPLRRLFGDVGMEIFDVARLSVHGGSLRIFVGRAGRRPVAASVGEMLDAERQHGLLGPLVYREFASNVLASRDALREMLARMRREGLSIAGLGASAKGNTLLNYCGIGPDTVSFIGDATPMKQGRFTPGMHIPVRPEEALRAECPDRTLLLAWNYADVIIERYSDYTSTGGRFIHPVPLARLMP